MKRNYLSPLTEANYIQSNTRLLSGSDTSNISASGLDGFGGYGGSSDSKIPQ
ncbi:MAG: hypothetical protein IJQ97_03195 [Paludibacteraceae bacterium]|nr:hypothetical protein [Paludibacteraceae bacterium]